MSHVGGPGKLSMQREAVDWNNRARAAHSERFLFAHIRDKRIQRLAAKFKDVKPRMTMDGFGPDKFAPIRIDPIPRKKSS
jgi:hypothetical protein